MRIPKLTTGHDSTLGNYKLLSVPLFGPESKAIEYLDQKIAKYGPDEPVLQDERQMLQLLCAIHEGVADGHA